MSEVKLAAQSRTEFGKGASRRLRRAGRVPAVMYGHGADPVHISLPGHETQLAMRVANALMSIEVDGGDEQLALPKQIQRDPVRDTIEHIDLIIVRRGEKVTVEVPLIVVGEPGDASAVVVADQQTIALEVEATNIPAQIEVSVAGLLIGAQVFAKDLALPEGAVFNGAPDDLMVSVNAPAVEAPVAEAAEGEGAEAEGEQAEAAEE
ncbi:50S ribosomal protein L25/general stress protein Ctc [Propionicicella superfundia]|uniref:50S ribosomal protein L25/general stress protein Ctc n=1 Tax=Propionicicella superfundia TaxID=348582 RepID=UPI00048B6D64|nr:50S ribosomal protein L25/general stress protein Ctc [Propionicicella superfundia]